MFWIYEDNVANPKEACGVLLSENVFGVLAMEKVFLRTLLAGAWSE